MSQDPVFVNFGVDQRSSTLLTDPQLQNAYAYSRNNPVAFKDPNGEFLFIPIVLTLALAGQLSYLYSTHQVVQILYSPTATPGEKSAARERFFANFAINGALMASGGGSGSLTGLKRAETLAEEGLPLLLDAMDYLYGDEVYKDMNKRREEQRHHNTVTIKGGGSGAAVGGGGSIYAGPSSSGSSGDSSRTSERAGSGLSSSQNSSLQGLRSVANAQSFDVQSFVRALQSVVNAFNSK
jgi:hypothetical protein